MNASSGPPPIPVLVTIGTRRSCGSGGDAGWRRRGVALVTALMTVAVCGLVGACAGTGTDAGSSSPQTAQARSIYQAGLWPQRPVGNLAFDVAPDLSSVTGRESVTFTPDLRTCQLVFRAWPNDPSEFKTGASLTVTDVTVNAHPVTPHISAAGAPPGAPGTLIDIPLSTCLNPGQSVHAELGFQLRLGAEADEVVGYSPRTHTAWFATGYPLLAWVRGKGWALDPAQALSGDGDFPVSEDANLALAVTAPADDQVVGAGAVAGTSPGPTPGSTTHRFTAPALRDVTIGVGHFSILDSDINGIHLHLATPTAGTKADPSDWADQIASSITSLTALFGPFPYPDFWVTVVSSQSDGTEYPDALQIGDIKKKKLHVKLAHECSHQWFYSLVGNNQAEDPWLDEALATYGEALVGGDADQYRYSHFADKYAGLMGEPLAYWADHGGSDRYDDAVYNQGGAVLLEARRQVGADRFDPALRAYIVANAHHVAVPADFAHAFATLPPVLALLNKAGALSHDNSDYSPAATPDTPTNTTNPH